MEIHVEVPIGDVTSENAAVGKSENFPSIETDEISDSELKEPKTSQSTIEEKTHTICEELGMTDKEVAPLEVETPFRDLPGCSGRDLALEGQNKEKSAASKNVSSPENEERRCSPGARAADNGAESQLIAERDSKTVPTKEVFSGKEEISSIKPAGDEDEDVPTAREYGDQELSSATGAGDD